MSLGLLATPAAALLVLTLVLPLPASHSPPAGGNLTQDEGGSSGEEILAEWRPRLRDRDPEIRKDALQQIASVALAHQDDPSKSVANLVARGLKDEDLGVRAEAARLLGLGLHPEVAVSSLVKAVQDVRNEMRSLRRDAGKGSPNISTTTVDGVRRPAGRAGEVQVYAETLLASLGRLPDDRSVKAVLSFADQPFEETSGALVAHSGRALLELGDRRCLSGVIELLVRIDRDERRHGISGDEDSEGGNELRVSSSMRGKDVFRLQFPAPDRQTARNLQESLREFAALHSLPASPTDEDARAWKEWAESVASTLPAKLGKLAPGG